MKTFEPVGGANWWRLMLARLRLLVYIGVLFPLDCVVALALILAEIVGLPLLVLRRSPPALPTADTSSVTLQVLNWDGRHLLEQFLPSVVAAAGDHTVLVVDNGSVDGSVAFLRQSFPRVKVLALDRNYGFGEGNNLGVGHARSDIVVFLNNDMAVAPDFLEPLLQPFSDPSVFAVASRISVPDPAKSHQETGKTRGRFENGMLYLWHDPVDSGDERRLSLPVFWAGGGACAVDRRRFQHIGGFDSLYSPFYVEDTDLSYQGWKRGWKSLFSAHSRVVHQHHATSGPRFGEDYVSIITRRNQFLLFWKNVTDLRMTLQHAVRLPRIHAQAIRQYGARFEFRAYSGAVRRLPRALFRRIAHMREAVLGDPDILNLTR